MFFQSTQSSSARIIGTAVIIPWPISDFSRMSVMRLSGVMCTQALRGLGVFFSCCCAGSSALAGGTWKPIHKPAPADAPVFRNARRSSVTVDISHLRTRTREDGDRRELQRAFEERFWPDKIMRGLCLSKRTD